MPLSIVSPEATRARVETLVTSADIAPTVYELAGIDWRPSAQESFVGKYGKSLATYLGMSASAGEPADSRARPSMSQDLDLARKRAIDRL